MYKGVPALLFFDSSSVPKGKSEQKSAISGSVSGSYGSNSSDRKSPALHSRVSIVSVSTGHGNSLYPGRTRWLPAPASARPPSGGAVRADRVARLISPLFAALRNAPAAASTPDGSRAPGAATGSTDQCHLTHRAERARFQPAQVHAARDRAAGRVPTVPYETMVPGRLLSIDKRADPLAGRGVDRHRDPGLRGQRVPNRRLRVERVRVVLLQSNLPGQFTLSDLQRRDH